MDYACTVVRFSSQTLNRSCRDLSYRLNFDIQNARLHERRAINTMAVITTSSIDGLCVRRSSLLLPNPKPVVQRFELQTEFQVKECTAT
jgi:hypothetical protein